MEIEHQLVCGVIASLAVNYLLGCVIPISTHVTLAILAVVATRYRRRIYIVARTFPRDVRFVYRLLSLVYATRKFQKNDLSVPQVFAEHVRDKPDKVLMYCNDETWTFKQVDEYSNRVANAFRSAGFQKGDVVALFMVNCPEYPCIWLGLSKIGVVTALINYNLRSQPLAHSVTAANAKAVIFGQDLAEEYRKVGPGLEKHVEMFQLGGTPAANSGARDMRAMLDQASASAPESPNPPIESRDQLIYIYTSGTTGLPKAAILPHSRYFFSAMAALKMLALSDDDVVYCPLPLYHTAGGIIGIGCGIVGGLSVVVRPKFSASAYFSDCAKFNCTVGQYIGELCRYVLATPPKPEDKQHRVRIMVGNGMRPSIWKTFMERFNIPNVYEIYGATEGNANIVNLDNTIGAVGFLPQSLPQSIYPVAIVKTDLETGEVIRNANGLCDRCAVNEPGMFLGQINNKDATREFHGYADKAASNKKVIEDVFVKGDKYFMTGDILVMDELGYLYFKDRTGETFRWKGENVSSAEVEAAICSILEQRDVAVYGVEVPNSEGRAGMVAILDPDNTLSLDSLAQGVDSILPSYARPIFVRKVPKMEMTGTYKIRKVNLQKEAFDLATVKDPLFIRIGKNYVPYTTERHQDLVNGKIRL